LDALIGIDMKENKYSFLRNEAIINQLPLVFEGFVKVNDESQEVDISFKTPSSDFKNFLAVMPEAYAKNIENVKTTGNFTVEGNFEGIVDETHIPKFNIAVRSDDASFKYPDLPKSVSHIHIDTDIKNTTGIAEDTFVEIRKASFNIDEDRFNLSSVISELMGNTRVKAHLDGRMNLANISKAYPVPADLNLKGLLTADIRTAFDMASVENKKYEKTQTSGQLNVKGFEYNSGEMANPVKIDAMSMSFNPGTVHLKEMTGSTGRTDFNVNGSISNLLGFLFKEEKVQGDFVMRSDTFVLNDFMVEDAEENGSAGKGAKKGQPATSVEERIKIPAFLDCSVNAAANTVHYDNLTLKDVRGNLKIKDEKVVLSDMTSSMFDGRLTLNGEVSTKNEKPLFAMQLGMDGFKIGETFKALELFRVLAPIAGILEGKLNSAIKISGHLEDDFTPDLKTISGNVLAEVLATDIQPGRAELLTSLSSKLAFLKPEKLNLKGLKTALSFEDGTVKVKPFTITYDDIAIKVDGGHTFDQKMSYTATLDVPAKYLGKEVNDLIARIDEKEVTSLTIPVAANIGGGYTNPVITTDFTSGIKDLTTKLVEIQKQKFINQGRDKATDLIGGLLADNRTKKDSISRKDSTRADIKDVLGGVLTTNTKKKDTAMADTIPAKKDPVESTARNILGGLLGKKKKDTTKTNSVN